MHLPADTKVPPPIPAWGFPTNVIEARKAADSIDILIQDATAALKNVGNFRDKYNLQNQEFLPYLKKITEVAKNLQGADVDKAVKQIEESMGKMPYYHSLKEKLFGDLNDCELSVKNIKKQVDLLKMVN